MTAGHMRRFLRFLAVVDGRSSQQLRSLFGYSRATVVRHLSVARELGVDVAYSPTTRRYAIVDPGPFDINKLRQVRV